MSKVAITPDFPNGDVDPALSFSFCSLSDVFVRPSWPRRCFELARLFLLCFLDEDRWSPAGKAGVLAPLDVLSDLSWNDTNRRLVCHLGRHIRRLWAE